MASQLPRPLTTRRLPLTPEDIDHWTSHISKILNPALMESRSRRAILNSQECDQINVFFARLYCTDFSTNRFELRSPGFIKSLVEMQNSEVWPEAMVNRAEMAVNKIKKEVPGFDDETAGLYGAKGRMHNIMELADEEGKEGWMLEIPSSDAFKTYQIGSVGFQPGDWWINRAAAIRDGVIGSLAEDVTYNSTRAYALVIAGKRELGADYRKIKYQASGLNKDSSVKILSCMESTSLGIRILREEGVESPYAPTAGVRYEGLYFLRTYGLRSDPNRPFRFNIHAEFERCPDQPSFARVLDRPNAEELMDYHIFQDTHESRVKPGSEIQATVTDNCVIVTYWTEGAVQPVNQTTQAGPSA